MSIVVEELSSLGARSATAARADAGPELPASKRQTRFGLAVVCDGSAKHGEQRAIVLQVCDVPGFELWLGCSADRNAHIPSVAGRLVCVGEAIEGVAPARFFRRVNAAAAVEADGPAFVMLHRVLADPVMRYLALSLASMLNNVADADIAFVDFAAAAMQAYLASRLTFTRTASRRRGGLAPWQQRRASELLLAGIGRHVPVAILADACRLSTSHFVRAFRQSTGLPPHQWITVRRIDLSKDLLTDGAARSLADVALACGFADQSHFTRTFSRVVGMSPGAWRRFGAAKPNEASDDTRCGGERHAF
ncbi:MAG TPA: helix-turn-helix transcriptional regulator [Rhodanobacteraceae bacterium]